MTVDQIRAKLYILKSQIRNDKTHDKNGKPLKWYTEAKKEIARLEKELKEKESL